MCRASVLAVMAAVAAVAAGAEDAWRAVAAGGVFAVETTVLLNAAERRDRELGYRILAELHVTPGPDPASGQDHLLLHFRLSDVALAARGAARSAEWRPRASGWDRAGGAWAARLRAGRLAALLLPPGDPPHLRNYKRALASLLQFQAAAVREGGPVNETDASGDCAVEYEALPRGRYRKIKRRCAADAIEGAEVEARRVTTYALEAPDGRAVLASVRAEEVLDVSTSAVRPGLAARAWTSLERRGPPGSAPAAPVGSPAALPLEEDDGEEDDGDEGDEEDEEDRWDEDGRIITEAELNDAIERNRAALEGEEAGEGGTAESAAALLRLLPALRAAPEAALQAALQRAERRRLAPLCRALGAAGTPGAVRAARAALQLAAPGAPEPLARALLAGLALAPRPAPAALAAALQLAADAREPAVRAAALLAAAAAARAPPAPPDGRARVRAACARELARCRDDACRAPALLALGNLGGEDALEPLLQHAARGGGRAPLAALAGLRAAPLRAEHLARLARLAANLTAPLEVRAAALDLVAVGEAAGERALVPLELLRLARELRSERSRAASELRRLLWQRLDALAAAPRVRELRRVLPPDLRAWDARAHGGTSSVLVREAGWARWPGARLDSVQVARGGVLRRGVVALHAGEGEAAEELLQVEVWLRGLEALAGGRAEEGEEGDGEGEGAAGGLAFSVGGVSMPEMQLFDGQAELLAAVWGGAGGEDAAVVRAARERPGAAGRVPLAAAGAALSLRARSALALALDARAAASLWHRTARAALGLRVARHARLSARLRTAGARLRATRAVSAEPRLQLELDLDFYDGVALCVRAAVPAHAARDELRLRSAAGARRLRVRRGASAAEPAPGRTLALGAANDAACRLLRARDAD